MPGKRRERIPKTHGREERRTEVFQKTKMCKFHILGICLRGEECKYAHHVSELQMAPDLYCTKMCATMVTQGSCTNPDCRYAHSEEELREMPSMTKAVEAAEGSPSRTSTCSDVETLKDPMKVELSIDMLSVHSTTASLSESSPLWDTSIDEFTPKSVTTLPWQTEQVDNTEEGLAGPSKDSFWCDPVFKARNAMPRDMPLFSDQGFDTMGYMSQDFGPLSYPPGLGGGYDNGTPWGWDSFQGFDLSSIQGCDLSSTEDDWQAVASRLKMMQEKTSPAHVSLAHATI